jgi:hypothetical protein
MLPEILFKVRAMVLIAVALGVWWGWLLDQLKPVHRLIAGLIRLLLMLCFVLVAAVFFHSIYAQYAGDWTFWTVRLFNFVTAPAQFWPILGFLAGWFGYRRRRDIDEFVFSPARPSPSGAAKDDLAGDTAPLEPVKSKKTAAQGLLARIAGLPLLGALILIAVLIFLGPELRSRLESLKFGDVEARFVAATQYSLRTTFTGFAPNIPIGESSSGLESYLEIDGRIQKEIMKRHVTADRDPVSEHKRLVKFHKEIVFPFADAMSCYIRTFARSDIELQRKSIRLALAWKEFSTQLAGPAAQRMMTRKDFVDRVNDTLALAREYAQAVSEKSPCWRAVPPDTPPVEEYWNHVSELFSSGYVIAFVANLIASTHDYEQPVEYLDTMAIFLDKSPVQRLGQVHFYLQRAAAKDYARWYPHDAASDLRHARSIIEELIGIVTGSAGADRQLILHLRHDRAATLNTEIFSTVRVSFEGYRLSPDQIAALEAAAAELLKWIKQYSPKALGDDPDQVFAGPTVNLIATAYDTLAVGEVAVGDSKGDRSKDRCARILEYLAKSKDLFQWWSQLRIQRGLDRPSDYRSTFRTLDAHHQLYASFCNQ